MPKTTLAGITLKGLRGSFHTDNGIRTPDKETVAAVRSSVKILSEAGVYFDQALPPGIDQTLELFVDLMNWDGGARWGHLRKLPAKGTSNSSQPKHITNSSIGHISDMIDRWDNFRARMLSFIAPYDLIVCPVNALPAMPHGLSQDNLDTFSYTMSYSLTGWPAAVVRAATSPDGLPIGVQIVARPWCEDVALLAAARIESELGGWISPAI